MLWYAWYFWICVDGPLFWGALLNHQTAVNISLMKSNIATNFELLNNFQQPNINWRANKLWHVKKTLLSVVFLSEFPTYDHWSESFLVFFNLFLSWLWKHIITMDTFWWPSQNFPHISFFVFSLFKLYFLLMSGHLVWEIVTIRPIRQSGDISENYFGSVYWNFF